MGTLSLSCAIATHSSQITLGGLVEFGLNSHSYRLLYSNLKVLLRYKLPDHSITFARWRQQHRNERVTLGFATHFYSFLVLVIFRDCTACNATAVPGGAKMHRC